jgi:hypothetical protein
MSLRPAIRKNETTDAHKLTRIKLKSKHREHREHREEKLREETKMRQIAIFYFSPK